MQAPPSPERVYIVTDEAAARVLLDAGARRWFAPFLARTSSVSAVAKLLGKKPNSVLYRVKRWHALGLLEVQREEKHRGRTVKLYRSVADAFFVPHRASSSKDLVELLRDTNAPYLRALYRGVVSAGRALSPDWGVQVFRSGAEVKLGAASAPGDVYDPRDSQSPAALEQFTHLRLDFEDAKAFQLELLNLLEKYGQKQGGQSYLSYLALAPLATSKEEL